MSGRSGHNLLLSNSRVFTAAHGYAGIDKNIMKAEKLTHDERNNVLFGYFFKYFISP